MYQITIKIPKSEVDGQPTSNLDLKQIKSEAITIMDKPISYCSNDSFDSITFNNVESNDTSMFSSLVTTYDGITAEIYEISEEV